MTEFTAKVSWQRASTEPFVDNRYSRGHQWEFDGGVIVPASASPHVVPLPYSVEANVDPEEAFVASLSSCHMLFFLSIAVKRKLVVDQYTDDASGVMENNSAGKIAVTKVVLRPTVSFAESHAPSRSMLEEMHHLAHDQCFIANSVLTEVVTEIP